jgi:adenosylhomocysteine nucleosidase
MSMNPVEFGFVAALEREAVGVVRGWQRGKVQIAGVERVFQYNQRAALVCAGTGVERAYTAAKVLIEKCSPRVVISIGFAGACVPHLRAGEVVVPASLLEAGTGRMFRCSLGRGQLVTLDRVAGKTLKQEACSRFGAQAVDMEAAGVALAAAECGKEFAAIKVISDEAEDELGFVSDFVKPEGFETGRFVAYIALRPQLWPRVAVLNRSSKLASAALECAVGECISDWQRFSEKYSGAEAASLTKESC